MIKIISRIRDSNLWHSAWHMTGEDALSDWAKISLIYNSLLTCSTSSIAHRVSQTIRGDIRMATARSFIDIINQLQPLYFVHIGFESYSVERAEEMILFIEVIWLYTVFRSLYPNVIKLAQNTLLEISWDGKRLLLYNQVQDYRRVYRIAQRSQGI